MLSENSRLPPPRKGAFVATPLNWGLLSRRGLLRVHAPWKTLIPHSTTMMADTSVATANTLSKEATLILLSASQPHQRSS